MPYYCTVPRCTSMAGKAKNVSFHQFPRDEDLAKLWNKILKRGKPYTKYSKVCSLHFRAEDYTITSVGKNKGQWRTLRKDAIPSQNLPLESPTSAPVQRPRNSGSWVPEQPSSVVDPLMHQQIARLIYMQTMLAMQTTGDGVQSHLSAITSKPTSTNDTRPNTSEKHQSEFEKFLFGRKNSNIDTKLNNINWFSKLTEAFNNTITSIPETVQNEVKPNNDQIQNCVDEVRSFKCDECSKCFKDPDVFVLHKRTHKNLDQLQKVEKENFNSNEIQDKTRQETLKANPILANLLKNVPSTQLPLGAQSIFNLNGVCHIEKQIMAAFNSNMETYLQNIRSDVQNQHLRNSSDDDDDDSAIEENQEYEDLIQESNIEEVENVYNHAPKTNDSVLQNKSNESNQQIDNFEEVKSSIIINSRNVIPDLVSDIPDLKFYEKDTAASDCDKINFETENS